MVVVCLISIGPIFDAKQKLKLYLPFLLGQITTPHFQYFNLKEESQ